MNRNRIIRTESLRDLSRYGITKAAAAIGVFDGVHRGHQKVLATLREIAQRTNSTPVVITFHPHPRSVLTPGAAPSLLYPQEEKLRLLRLYGAEAVVVIPFTQEFAALSPDQFLDQSLHSGTVKLTGVCVGRAWRFGAKAAGSYVDLERRAKLDRFVFSPVDEVTFGDGVVSSTEIRKAVAGGDSILTTSGFYGVVIDMTDEVVIVEFGSNKNCRIPMQKSAIVEVNKAEEA